MKVRLGIIECALHARRIAESRFERMKVRLGIIECAWHAPRIATNRPSWTPRRKNKRTVLVGHCICHKEHAGKFPRSGIDVVPTCGHDYTSERLPACGVDHDGASFPA